jgi:benzoyl-CoA reductase/2-hydroxyglutaryl-CoA dehydratase subunit BcrC/BadD/HgdB
MGILDKKRLEVWELIYDSILSLEKILARLPTARVHKEILRLYRQYVEKLFDAVDRDKKIIWSNFAVPTTLMRGFDEDKVFWYMFETLPIALISMLGGINARMIDAAEAAGVPPEVCSMDRIALGSVIENCIPRAEAAFYITTPCDSQTCLVNNMVAKHKMPTIVVDMPYRYGPEQVSYLAGQFREAVEFLEESLGVRYAWDRLKQASQLYNEMMETILEWVDMRRLNPAPQNCETISLMIAVVILFSGTHQGVDYAREMLADLKERHERGKQATKDYEIRAIWYGDPIWSNLTFYNWLERELHVTVPMDMFAYYAPVGLINTDSETGMLEGIARNSMRNFPMTRQLTGSMDDYIDDYVKLCQVYQADFGVFPGHLGCTHAWGALRMLKRASEKINVPLLSFEFDMLDQRVTPLEDIQTLFTRFVNEIVLPRKGM